MAGQAHRRARFPPASGRGSGRKVQLWEWHLPEAFPLNLDHCLLGFPAADSHPQDFLDNLRAIPQTRMRVVLLISPSSDYQRRLYDITKDRTNTWVAPSRSELTNLLLSPTPEITLANLWASQLTLIQLSPYQLGGGVNREAVFFGRQEINAHIMNRDPANYLVVGGRQLGKSSLLKAHGATLCGTAGCRLLLPCALNEVLVPRLASALALPHRAGLEEIAAHVAAHGRAGSLLDRRSRQICASGAGKRLPHPRDSASYERRGHCNFILAGFWELYEQAVLITAPP